MKVHELMTVVAAVFTLQDCADENSLSIGQIDELMDRLTAEISPATRIAFRAFMMQMLAQQ